MATVKAALVGGPADLSNDARIREVADLSQDVKITFGGGYEHFSHRGEFSEFDQEELAIFQWSGRTRIAE